MDPDGILLTADPFYSPELFLASKPNVKKFKKNGDSNEEKDQSDLVNRIQQVDLSEYRIKDLDLYRQIVQDTLILCEEEIVNPYISRILSLHDVNEAVKFIQEKKCTGKVLIDLKAEQSAKEPESGDESESK